MDVYNLAIKYLKDTFGETPKVATYNGMDRIRKCRNEKEKQIERSNENNYSSAYNKPPETDVVNYQIHLLVTQFYYSAEVKKELEVALYEVGVIKY